jgi:hypothetical protein
MLIVETFLRRRQMTVDGSVRLAQRRFVELQRAPKSFKRRDRITLPVRTAGPSR